MKYGICVIFFFLGFCSHFLYRAKNTLEKVSVVCDVEDHLASPSTLNTKEVSLQYDLLPMIERRKKALEVIADEMRRQMKRAIASPDIAWHMILQNTLLRFERVDMYQMSFMAPVLEEKRNSFATKDEKKAFDATVDFLMINQADVYQRKVDDIAVSSSLIKNGLERLRAATDVIEVATLTRAMLRLFEQIKKDPLVSLCVGIEPVELDVSNVVKDWMRRCLKSNEKYDHAEEMESIFFLKAQFPDV